MSAPPSVPEYAWRVAKPTNRTAGDHRPHEARPGAEPSAHASGPAGEGRAARPFFSVAHVLDDRVALARRRPEPAMIEDGDAAAAVGDQLAPLQRRGRL